MKIFTKKIFLLAIGMILSVGVYAQGDGIKHRFPQFDFTYKDGNNTIQAYVPAWESRSWKSGKHWGSIRFQAKKVETKDGKYEFESKIVTRGAIRKDNSNYADISKTTQISFTDKNGNPKTMAANEISYGHFVPDTYDDADQGAWWTAFNYGSMSGSTYDYYVFDFSASGNYCVDTNDYTIIDSWTESSGNKHTITEIDNYAFRNFSVSGDSTTYWFRPKTITIPATITKIGQGAFYSNLLANKVIFAPDNVITEIPAQCFMNLYRVEEITFSKKVNSIGGAALGGCKWLKRIVFNNTEAPNLKVFTRDGHTYDCFTATGTASPTVPSKCIIEVPLHSAKAYANKADEQNNYLFKQFPMSSKFPITTSSGITSFCSDLPFTFKQYDPATPEWNDGEVTAYYVTKSNVDLDNNNIELSEITGDKKIPLENPKSEFGFGVILKGEANKTYDIFYPNNLWSEEFTVTQNLLQGVTEPTTMVLNPNFTYYALSGGKFHPVQLSDDPAKNLIGAHKAFLMFQAGEEMDLAREFTISFPEATGIVSHETKSPQNNVFYNLQGVQVKNPEKGVFIRNGKKFIIK